MKREIKFRGRKLDGTWLYGYYTIFEGYHKIWCEKHSTPYDVDGETVGEFTGLKDKNGKEIYEGDILEWPQRKVKDKRVIEYIDNGFWIHGIRGFEMPAEHLREIIGNIHENPELI